MEDECNGKRGYDKKSAITAANKRFKEDHVRLRVYQCGDHWHLTKQLRGTRKLHGKKKRYKDGNALYFQKGMK